jgi:hypothetical protein
MKKLTGSGFSRSLKLNRRLTALLALVIRSVSCCLALTMILAPEKELE